MSDEPVSYAQRGNASFETVIAERRARTDASFVLPLLRRGMRLLDVGCGPGSITVDLAGAVAPGAVVGIDVQPSQVDRARALARERGVENVTFDVADAGALPFPDASFDAAFAHAVLMHLNEPVRALAEVRRVLRPGGFVAVRDPDSGSTLRAPANALRDRWRELALRVVAHKGGDPFVGRRHRRLLLDAGFTRTEASASLWCAGDADAIQQHATFLKAQLAGLSRTAVELGWIDEETVAAVDAELDAWTKCPDAFSATTWCEAVGWVEPG